MPEQVPESGPEFIALMREEDPKLSPDGVAITARPILALGEISRQFKIRMPIGEARPGAPEHVRRFNALSENVNQWFTQLYGTA